MWGLFFDIMIVMSPNYGLKELRCSVGDVEDLHTSNFVS